MDLDGSLTIEKLAHKSGRSLGDVGDFGQCESEEGIRWIQIKSKTSSLY